LITVIKGKVMEWKKLMVKTPSLNKIRQKLEKENPNLGQGDIEGIIDILRFLTLAAIERYLGKQ
jgi:hypothetical protein